MHPGETEVRPQDMNTAVRTGWYHQVADNHGAYHLRGETLVFLQILHFTGDTVFCDNEKFHSITRVNVPLSC